MSDELKCPSCGVPYSSHLGLILTCQTVASLTAKVERYERALEAIANHQEACCEGNLGPQLSTTWRNRPCGAGGEVNHAIRLDFPPTVNTYYRRGPKGMYLSKSGRNYKATVKAEVAKSFGAAWVPSEARLGVQIELAAPNKTRDSDIDNRVKGVLDSLQGILFVDDGQIDQLIVKRLPIAPGGYCDVIVSEL